MITPGDTGIEVLAAAWRRSSHSGSGNNCVEVAQLPAAVAVRDSKNPGAGQLIFTARDWAAFVAGIRQGTCTR